MLNLVGYRIQAQIYSSRNSLVYRGWRSQDQFPVVLKQLKPERCIPAHLACYRKEYSILRDLQLPGVIRAYGLEPCENSLVLILEDCGGQSLEQWLEEWQSAPTDLLIPLQDFLQIAIAITDSLSQLHAAQIIHKDIKPSNIIWNPETSALRLIDFGIATQGLGESPAERYLKRLEGTLAYLAPEQTGHLSQAIDHRADLYALGATFYELLTGQIPFQGQDANTIIQGHLTQLPTPPHFIKPQIPPALSEIVLRLMAKDASDRYPSADDLRVDLIACLTQLQQQQLPKLNAWEEPAKFFRIPTQYYGRETEVAAVLDWVDRVLDAPRSSEPQSNLSTQPSPAIPTDAKSYLESALRLDENPVVDAQHSAALLMIQGKSGVGKTTLLKMVRAACKRPDIYSIQAVGNPKEQQQSWYWVKQALIDLIQQVQPQAELKSRWSGAIVQTLGSQVMRLRPWLPELNLLLVDQDKMSPSVNPALRLGFADLIASLFTSFTQLGLGVMIWGDDCQWADPDSLHLLQRLTSQAPASRIVVIGACDDLVGLEHPLLEMVAQSLNRPPAQLILPPLTESAIQAWVADALQTTSPPIPALAEFIAEKSGGNMLFATELLKYLEAQGYLLLQDQEWQVDFTALRAASLPDHAIALFTERLQQLPHPVLALLQAAAQRGMQFELETLRYNPELAELIQAGEDLTDYLWQAMQADLIQPVVPLNLNLELISDTAAEATLSNSADSSSCPYQFRHHQVLQAVCEFSAGVTPAFRDSSPSHAQIPDERFQFPGHPVDHAPQLQF